MKNTWKPKVQIDSKLESKGFIIVIFTNLEDHILVFEWGPYFINFTRLYLRFWIEHFCPDKEIFMASPIWIRLYSLQREFWEEEDPQRYRKFPRSLCQILRCNQMGIKYILWIDLCVYGHAPSPPSLHIFIFQGWVLKTIIGLFIHHIMLQMMPWIIPSI